MIVEDMIEAGVEEIKQTLHSFCKSRDMERLTPELAEEMTCGIKEAFSAAGVAMYRKFLMAFEERAREVEVEGKRFRLKFSSTKRFMTFFGQMVLTRNVFQDKTDTRTYIPLDSAWGMRREFMTVEVREAVAFSSGLVTPEETATLLGKCALFHPHPTAIKLSNKALGECMEEHRETLDARIRSEERLPEKTTAVAVSLDGTNVLLREEGAKLGRPARRPQGDRDKERTTAYKNAMVASISCYGRQEEGEKGPQRLSCHYVSRMPEDRAPTFKRQVEAELDAVDARCGPEIDKLLLLDGARPLWNYVDQEARFDGYHKLLDYWHSTEHLSQAAQALFGRGTAEAKQWYDKYRRILIESDCGAHRVLRSMDYYETNLKLPKSRKKELQTQRTFFKLNRHRMRYAHFRRHGWPIGSGPVEAACKALVKTRLCRSGMRWSRQGGQTILDLRTYIKSGRWDVAWKHIKALRRAA